MTADLDPLAGQLIAQAIARIDQRLDRLEDRLDALSPRVDLREPAPETPAGKPGS